MGHIFNVPIVRVADLGATLSVLHREHGVQSYAAVIDEDAKLLKHVQRPAPGRWCCVLGSEDTGVSDAVRAAEGIVSK